VSFVDLTATLRLPRAPDEEDGRSLALAAKAGGVGVVVCSARGQEAVDVESLSALARSLEGAGVDGVRLVAAVSPLVNNELADVASMMKALPAAWPRVLRLRAAVDDALLLRRIGAVAAALDALVILPSHDAALMKGAVAVEGAVATRLGLPSVPEASEHIAISRIVEVSKLTGARFHVAGVFSERGASIVDDAGDLVSGSVFASHLLLDEGALLAIRYDTRVLTRPPLPSSSSRAALLDAVKSGALLVSSGHHAIPKRERDLEIDKATPGLTSLSSTARLLSHVLSATELHRALSSGPAALLAVALGEGPAPTGAEVSVDVDDDLSRLVSLVSSEVSA
jgi:dihydroorotase